MADQKIAHSVVVVDPANPGAALGPSYLNAAAIVPSDSTVLSPPLKAIWVGVTGNIAVVTFGGQTVTFSNVPVGWLTVACTKVKATGTTATTMIGVW